MRWLQNLIRRSREKDLRVLRNDLLECEQLIQYGRELGMSETLSEEESRLNDDVLKALQFCADRTRGVLKKYGSNQDQT